MNDKPTELTSEDIDKFVDYLMNHEIRMEKCFQCGKEYLPNYSDCKCDECFFAQFPKEEVKAFYRSFFE